MFVAFSNKLQCPISAKDVTDLSDTFKCPNCNCSAKYIIKATGSTARSAHFAKKRLEYHIPNCPYKNENHRYIDKGEFIKISIEDILNHEFLNKAEEHKDDSITQHTENDNAKHYIRTPKQLFQYCISNDIDTEYMDGLTVCDIFLDERSLCLNKNYIGKPGTYFVLGKTYRYNRDSNSVEMYLKSKTRNNKTLSLTITVTMKETHLNELIKHILGTFHSFAGHSIAVLGKWECDEMYHIQCTAIPRNIVYNFTDKA